MPEIHFLLVAPILFVVCLITAVGFSWLTPPPDAEAIQPYVWTRQLYRAEGVELSVEPWYKNYRVLSLLLLAVTAGLVVLFW